VGGAVSLVGLCNKGAEKGSPLNWLLLGECEENLIPFIDRGSLAHLLPVGHQMRVADRAISSVRVEHQRILGKEDAGRERGR